MPLNSRAFVDQAVGQTSIFFEIKIFLSLPGNLFALFVLSYAITLMHNKELLSIDMIVLLCQFHVAVNPLSKLLRFFLVILRVKDHLIFVVWLKSNHTLLVLAWLERHAILCGWAKKLALFEAHIAVMVLFANCAALIMAPKAFMDAVPILYELFITSLLDE